MDFQHPDFTSTEDPQTLIVFGLVGNPDHILTELERAEGAVPALTNRYAIISASTDDIRLSSPGWTQIGLSQRLALETSEELYLLCAERMLQNTPPFSGPTRQFLRSYLDFVEAEVARNRQKLVPVQPGTEVFTHQDFAFSAWLPFPDARILLPPDYPGNTPAFAEVSVAFRLHGRIVAVLIEGTGTPIGSKRRRLDYLLENHPNLDIVRIQKDQLRSGVFPIEAFSDSFAYFWRGVGLPIGPCPPLIEMLDEAGDVDQEQTSK